VNNPRSNLIDVGRICGVYGIKGWVKVKSFTQPTDNLFNYPALFVKTQHGVKPCKVISYEQRPKGYVAQFDFIKNRTDAEHLGNATIAIEKSALVELGDDDFYWHDLIGLDVIASPAYNSVPLGVVHSLIETGANDVLVVKPSDQSVDARERLIPYVFGQYILKVDVQAKQVHVDWDPEF